jgi:uncharacterized zinc-type alcohol dehydrogenase-like protein
MTEFWYKANSLRSEEVEVKIDYCGCCHSVVHQQDNDFGLSHLPIVPVHEIIGQVIPKGDAVDTLDVGARVGIGLLESLN